MMSDLIMPFLLQSQHLCSKEIHCSGELESPRQRESVDTGRLLYEMLARLRIQIMSSVGIALAKMVALDLPRPLDGDAGDFAFWPPAADLDHPPIQVHWVGDFVVVETVREPPLEWQRLHPDNTAPGYCWGFFEVGATRLSVCP